MKKLKPHTVDWAQIERFLTSADKKLVSAHRILEFDEEAAACGAMQLLKSVDLTKNPAIRLIESGGQSCAVQRMCRQSQGKLSVFAVLLIERLLAQQQRRAVVGIDLQRRR